MTAIIIEESTMAMQNTCCQFMMARAMMFHISSTKRTKQTSNTVLLVGSTVALDNLCQCRPKQKIGQSIHFLMTIEASIICSQATHQY